MNADTSGTPEPGERSARVIYEAADASPCDLGFWDAPWPLEPTANQRREPLRGPSRLTWAVVSLAVLLIALLLAGRSYPVLLGVRLPAALGER